MRQTLNSLFLEKCAVEHPHHTIPIILALSNANSDRRYTNAAVNTVSNEPRVLGAIRLMQKLRNNEKTKNIVQKMERLSDALISLAYLEQERCQEARAKNTFVIPVSAAIMKIKALDEALVPTYSLPVSKTRNYSNIIGKLFLLNTKLRINLTN